MYDIIIMYAPDWLSDLELISLREEDTDIIVRKCAIICSELGWERIVGFAGDVPPSVVMEIVGNAPKN